MNTIIQFIFKWMIPIGFVQIIARKNDSILSKDNFGNQTYWRLYSLGKKFTGADILIRRS